MNNVRFRPFKKGTANLRILGLAVPFLKGADMRS